jgi:hypothetical protein
LPTISRLRGSKWHAETQPEIRLDRPRAGREVSPTAAVIFTQSVKTTKAGGRYCYSFLVGIR